MSLLSCLAVIPGKAAGAAPQVDASGNAIIAGWTQGSLDSGRTNAGGADVFVMGFNRFGMHLFTGLAGGFGNEIVHALQARGVTQGTLSPLLDWKTRWSFSSERLPSINRSTNN